jgi:hypothetical protein
MVSEPAKLANDEMEGQELHPHSRIHDTCLRVMRIGNRADPQ